MSSVKETVEALEAIKVLGEQLEKAYGDHSISFMEVMQIATSMIQPAYAAIVGAEKIPGEIMGMDGQAASALGQAAFEAMQPYLRLWKNVVVVPV